MHYVTNGHTCLENVLVHLNGSAREHGPSARLRDLVHMSLSPDGSDAHDPDSEFCRLAVLQKNRNDVELPLDLFQAN